MSLLRPTEPWPRKDCRNERYYSCVLCGPQYLRYELQYDGAAANPTLGETITGVTSGATGVFTSWAHESGSHAAATAAGTVELSNVTGATAGLAFTDNEPLSGSDGFLATANGQAIEKVYGLKYPEGDSVERDGKRYCAFHYELRFRKRDADADIINIDEET